MVDAVVLGVIGVLVPSDVLERAEAEVLRAWQRRPVPRPSLRHHRRAALCAARSAVPPARPLEARSLEPLLRLRSSHRLAFLDMGAGARLEALVERLGVAGLVERKLWTEDLGLEARPPRRLAFRWLAERLDVRPSEVLYVAGRAVLARAARAAGWRVAYRPHEPQVDLDALADWLDSGAPPAPCAWS